MQRPAEDNRQPCQAAHQPDNARRPPHVCDVGVDKGRGYRDCEQDACPFQRDNDREIRPGASDERHTGLCIIEVVTYFSHNPATFGDTCSDTYGDTFGDTFGDIYYI